MLPGALLFLLPVVVVDVSGDRLDPDHTRQLVGTELAMDAVAPDDPRAAQATGRIEVRGNAKDGKLIVRYRKVDEPIERSVPLAGDSPRAESDAALLAGNLARDEASELAPVKPAMPSPLPPPPPIGDPRDATRLEVMRGVLTQLHGEEQSARVRGGVVALVTGAAVLGTGVWALARGGADDPEPFGYALATTSTGAALVIVGTIILLTKASIYQPFLDKLREEEKNGTAAGDVVEEVDKAWAKAASEEKGMRTASAVVGFIAGGLLTGSAIYFATSNDDDKTTPIALGMVGTANIGLGIATLLTEGPVESSYRLWKTVRTAPTADRSPLSNISVGATVLPGGGGAASFALTF
jgi:hypothetical protein